MILLKARVCANELTCPVRFLGCLLTEMDEIARGVSLAGHVRLEISVDAVLHFATEGLVQQSCKALQTMRVVGETEFAGEQNERTGPEDFIMSNVLGNGV